MKGNTILFNDALKMVDITAFEFNLREKTIIFMCVT